MTLAENKKEDYTEEIEQSFIGILLAFPHRIPDILGIVSDKDFIFPIHSEIFNECIELYNNGKIPSPVVLKAKFHDREDTENGYLAELAGSVFSDGNLLSYAESIRKLSDKRLFIETLEEALANSYSSNDVDTLKPDVIAKIQNSSDKGSFTRTNQAALNEVILALSKPIECNPTGINILDKAMAGGLYSGFTYGFAGAEKSGKTTIAQTISYNLNYAGTKHAYIALEMGSTQIEQRNLARKMGINSLAFLEKQNPDFIKRAANEAIQVPQNTVYADMAGCNFQQIKAEIMPSY